MSFQFRIKVGIFVGSVFGSSTDYLYAFVASILAVLLSSLI